MVRVPTPWRNSPARRRSRARRAPSARSRSGPERRSTARAASMSCASRLIEGSRRRFRRGFYAALRRDRGPGSAGGSSTFKGNPSTEQESASRPTPRPVSCPHQLMEENGMYDHVSLKVKDFARSKRFYEKALAPLGFTVQSADATSAGFVAGDSGLYISQ